jgi:hypothetical protein
VLQAKYCFTINFLGVFDCVPIQLTPMKHVLFYFVSIHKEEASNFRKKADLRVQVSNTHLPELQTVYSQQNKVNGLIIE